MPLFAKTDSSQPAIEHSLYIRHFYVAITILLVVCSTHAFVKIFQAESHYKHN
jgi:hypothetical protein